MKAIYQKPITEIMFVSSGAIMLTVSGGGQQIVTNGGDTQSAGITSGDSRRFDLWAEDEDEE